VVPVGLVLTLFAQNQKYEHLFNINEKTKGGSFYLQSKVQGGGCVGSRAVV
jgi:hypothetical protein